MDVHDAVTRSLANARLIDNFALASHDRGDFEAQNVKTPRSRSGTKETHRQNRRRDACYHNAWPQPQER